MQLFTTAPTKKVGKLKHKGMNIIIDAVTIDSSAVCDGKSVLLFDVVLPLENVVCAAYRDLGLSLEAVALMRVLFIDGNPDNLCPENVIPACYPQTDEFYITRKGFTNRKYKRIPVCDFIAVSPLGGAVLDLERNEILDFALNNVDDVKVIKHKGIEYTTTLNTLLTLAFKEYSTDIEHLIEGYVSLTVSE